MFIRYIIYNFPAETQGTEVKLVQRGRAMLCVVDKSLKVIPIYTVKYGVCKFLLVVHCNCVYLVSLLFLIMART